MKQISVAQPAGRTGVGTLVASLAIGAAMVTTTAVIVVIYGALWLLATLLRMILLPVRALGSRQAGS